MRFVDGLLGHDPDNIYNSHGHRCKELSELNLRNYILFVGDNAGLQLNKPIEETLPYLTAKELAVDYYNLCIFNGGSDAIKFNLFSWLFKFPKPKAIIIASEFFNSFLISDQNHSFIDAADLSDDMVTDAINAANNNGFFNGRRYMLDTLISNSIQIPIYQLSIKDKIKVLSEIAVDIDYDPNSPQITASKLASEINKVYAKAKASI
jgi:hypothetical protein